jgi:hypothetical protein
MHEDLGRLAEVFLFLHEGGAASSYDAARGTCLDASGLRIAVIGAVRLLIGSGLHNRGSPEG